jgi:hypothetical protein
MAILHQMSAGHQRLPVAAVQETPVAGVERSQLSTP